MAEKRYFWLRLRRDFFKRHDIQIIENMPNGKDYILFYLKLMVESIDHEGALRFSDTIPYNEEMLSVITRTNIDIVRAAMKLFNDLGMVEILDDQTIFMSEVEALLGSETEWAKKKRLYRQKKDDPPALPPGEPPKKAERKTPAKHKYGEYNNVLLTDAELEKLKSEYADWKDRIERLSSYIESKGAKYKSHYATIRNWARKDKKEEPKKIVSGDMADLDDVF